MNQARVIKKSLPAISDIVKKTGKKIEGRLIEISKIKIVEK